MSVATGRRGVHHSAATQAWQKGRGLDRALHRGRAAVLPGKQLQPPRQHADEEFQYVIEGSGTWSLNGVEVPLAAGDLMYAKPWDWHGIRNSGDKPLRFFVFKWKARGVPEPAKPAG